MARVTLTNLCKSYDQHHIIRELNLDIADREFVVLVGPSGCGKSTVLRMIAGLESISQGTVSIDDQVVNQLSPKDRDIAMVFQSYALYPHMSVYDNMAFGLKMRKTPKAEIRRRVEEAAGILDLTHLLTRKPKQLSGGQRQRVALGRAIVRNPKVFLMDEPLSNLDAKLRIHMRAEIQKLHRRLDATTIYVTHDQTEAMTMADRIVILNGGVIQQVGSPEAVYHRPANVFVGGFIGSMYFIPARYAEGRFRFASGQSWEALRPNGQEMPSEVLIGIRPEHFMPSSSESRQTITVTPDLTEMLGHEKLVHFQWEGQPLVASLPPDLQVTVGQPLTLGLATDKLNYFDAQTQHCL